MAEFKTFLLVSVALAVLGCNQADKTRLAVEVEKLESQARETNDERRAKYGEFQRKKNLIRNFETLQEKESLEKIELEVVEKWVADLRVADAYLAEKVDLWRQATRESLAGLALGNITLTDGRVVVGATVGEVSDDHVVIKYDNKEETISYELLPLPVRRRLVHEETILAEARLRR